MVITQSPDKVRADIKSNLTDILVSIVLIAAAIAGIWIAVQSLGEFLVAFNNNEPRIEFRYRAQGLYGAAFGVAILIFYVLYTRVFKQPERKWSTLLIKFGLVAAVPLTIVPPLVFKYSMESDLKNAGYIMCPEIHQSKTIWATSKETCKNKNDD